MLGVIGSKLGYHQCLLKPSTLSHRQLFQSTKWRYDSVISRPFFLSDWQTLSSLFSSVASMLRPAPIEKLSRPEFIKHSNCYIHPSLLDTFSCTKTVASDNKKISKLHSSTFARSDSTSIFDFVDRAPTAVAKSFRFASGASAFPKNYDPSAKATLRGSKPDVLSQEKDLLSVTCGEDAYFVRPDSMGVADGVGAWAYSDDKRASSAWFSTKLLHYMSDTLQKMSDVAEIDYHIDADPKAVLEHSYALLMEEAKQKNITGSTTVALAILRDDELKVCNLGDCGVLVIRDGQMVFRTEEQQHSFNFPFQVGTNAVDKPEHAGSFSFKVREGDIIIMGSDGLFDNLYDEDIVAIVRQHISTNMRPQSPSANKSGNPDGAVSYSVFESINPQAISYDLARRAREVAEDVRYVSTPFLNKAIQEGLYYNGGKLDDITVVLSHVRLSEDSPDRR